MSTPPLTPPKSPPSSSRRPWLWIGLLWIGVALLVAAALWWFRSASMHPGMHPGEPVATLQPSTSLTSGTITSMDSPVFVYDKAWIVSPLGADPGEPDDPWQTPAGRVTFVYSGRELALQLAMGDYWGYLFVTVDGAPANQLPNITGTVDSLGEAAGYKPLLAPERQTTDGTAAVWIPVHHGQDDGPHEVTIEVWRGWGQIPLRGVAVDALSPPSLPRWPATAFLLAGLWSLYVGFWTRTQVARRGKSRLLAAISAPIRVRVIFLRLHPWLMRTWPVALLLIGAGVVGDSWLLTDAGLALLGLIALARPELWVAALLFGLPFYLLPLPILPGRSLNLIEVGVWGGVAILAVSWTFFQRRDAKPQSRGEREGKKEGKRQKGKAKVSTVAHFAQFAMRNSQSIFLALIISIALISATAAAHVDVALREWRTVFLAGGGFALLLGGVFALSDDEERSRRCLFNAWLAGGTTVAIIALWQFASGQMIIQAEGVTRVRGLYGSPNNLALYLERTVAVGIGYYVLRGAFFDSRRERWIRNAQFAILLLPQVAALVLTFSKGALFLGLPAMLVTLAVGGMVLLARQGKSLRFLWWLAAISGVIMMGMLPFLNTERFRLLLDFGAGTTGGLRLNLWRSAWAMALDHPWLGVGPDNFLYAYRSDYILPAAWQDPNLNHPHDFILDWWTRLGLPSLLLAGAWLGIGVRRLWGQLRNGANPVLALGCLAAVAAALAHGLIDASYALPDLMLVWVLLISLPSARYPQSPRQELRC